VYLARQSASAVAALLFIFGSLGLYLAIREGSGVFGAVAFVTAFVGSCFVGCGLGPSAVDHETS
jgi:hypothetical protein